MTYFEEIYELATTIMESEEIRQAPLYKKYLFLYRFLQFSIGEFNTRCYRDLTTIQPFNYKSYQILGDGLEKEFKIPSPFLFDTQIYVEKETDNGIYVPVSSDKYIINNINNSIVFNDAPRNGEKMKIYAYEIGYFYDDLDLEEKTILANGMIIPFYQEQLNRTTLMNQQVYGVGAKMYSQAEHIKRLSDLIENRKQVWTSRINAYTYSKNPDLVLDKSRRQKEIKKDYR